MDRPPYPQVELRFRRWWQVLGSNQRRLSRRFYSGTIRLFGTPGDLVFLTRAGTKAAVRPSGVRAVGHRRERMAARLGYQSGRIAGAPSDLVQKSREAVNGAVVQRTATVITSGGTGASSADRLTIRREHERPSQGT